jgi:hypothetical protein
MKYFYENDILLIKKVELKTQPDGSIIPINKTIHIVSPIYRNVKTDEIPQKTVNLSSFNSTFICNFVIFKYINGQIMMESRIDYNRVGTHLIRFEDDALNIHNNFIKSIVEAVRPQT